MDGLVDLHKKRLRSRKVASESLMYMQEASDQVGLGEEFLRFWVHNPQPTQPDPTSDETDLALLDLYKHWRKLHNLRPIEAWDGTRLRPWLEADFNPRVPAALDGDLDCFNRAFSHNPPFEDLYWRRADALGNAVESYLTSIRRHQVWAPAVAGGKLRLYVLNELNNIETAPYSVRFWGFLQWAENLRRKLFVLPAECIPHDELSDITFLDRFNIDHFPWHDDVFEFGRCARWDDQYGRRQRFKYAPDTQGYGLEFLQFHNDLLRAYDQWAAEAGFPPCCAWSSGRNHSAYILKYAFGGPWGLGGNNGKPLDPAVFAPDLLDPNLSKFRTAAELGSFLERCGVMWHGTGHVENCDIRDVYTNNYSVRFVGWHSSIDVLFKKLKDLGRPLFDERLPLDAPIPPDAGTNTYCEHFSPSPEMHGFGMKPFTGTWLYRSFYHESDPEADPRWFVAEMRLHQHDEQLKGEMVASDPAYRYELIGHIDQRNISYQLTPDWFDERLIVVLTATGATKETAGQEFQYRAYYPASHPGQIGIRSLVGCVTQVKYPPDQRHEGRTGSFFAIPIDIHHTSGDTHGHNAHG